MSVRLPTLLSAALLLPLSAASPILLAQDAPKKVHVGDAEVDGSFIKGFTSSFDLIRKGPDGKTEPFGSWTDDVTILTRDGKSLLRRKVARYNAAGEKDLERVHINDQTTLAPLITHQISGPGLQQMTRFEVTDKAVKVVAIQDPERPSISAEVTLAEAPFDLSLYAILLLGFPKTDGYAASFPIVGPGLQLAWETMRVGPTERVAVENGREVDAVKVTTETRTWSVWFEPEAPYIAKIVQRFPDGSEWTSIRRSATRK